MLKPHNQRTFKFSVLFVILLLGVSSAVSSPHVQEQTSTLPPGKGVELVVEKCTTCHEADLIVQQRLTHLGWGKEVDKMIRWGTVATSAEKEIIVDYLASHFGSEKDSTQVVSSTAERGLAIFQEKCLTCHEADLTEQQRLTSSGWKREVEKMIRWGATVKDDEKEPLVTYLAQQFGLKRQSQSQAK